jgi:hypothetical protein
MLKLERNHEEGKQNDDEWAAAWSDDDEDGKYISQ